MSLHASRRFPFEICCVCCIIFFWDFLMRCHAFCPPMRFPYEIVCVLQCTFRTRFPLWNLILSAAQFSCNCKMSLFGVTPFWPIWSFLIFLMRIILFSPFGIPYETLCFWVVLRFPYKSFCVWLDSFLLRFHCFFAVMRFLHEISCFLLRICF